MFFLQQNQTTRGQSRFCLEGLGLGEVAQIMYTHVSTCKNDKDGNKTSADGKKCPSLR
jgi:hypothetical protein